MLVTLMATFSAALAGRVQAQGVSAPQTKLFLSVDAGAQPTQREFETSTSIPLYDEAATITTKQAIHNGPLFGVTLGYRLKPRLGIGVGFSMFNARESDSNIVASIPDLAFFGRPKIVTQTVTGLKHTEQVLNLQVVWFHPVAEKFEVVLAAGPSAFYVKQDLVSSVTVAAGTQSITAVQDNQVHGAFGFNAGFEGNYLFNARFGAGIFARYVGGKVDLPAVSGLTLGGVQAGLGIRARF